MLTSLQTKRTLFGGQKKLSPLFNNLMKKKIFYWSPCLNPVGTVISTINSAISLSKYDKNNDVINIDSDTVLKMAQQYFNNQNFTIVTVK